MHFMVLNQVKCYERFNQKKSCPFDHLKFILKCFYIGFMQNSKKFCLDY